ncbi:MarR family transcriptional regulator [Streptomyces sp. NBC_01808]|uniref:MarR family winged helix-turn-helix transcriptional regulator n=1 Tax=Streptomyces sp. NBC_01808 TaxID=2975947 RepID=UPI002DDAA9D6|nr:MarR family transcriptional regulator [Streptomyces sp. NBC_01808]WSA37650.1 MarR family transcriptional regulator [Streptomyces sp. NBC_01808]
MSVRPPEATHVSSDVAEIERALSRIAYLSSRARQHDRLMALAEVPLDRAAVALLRQIDDSEPLRLGELADRLGVEASHVTRQVQQLQKAAYVSRVPDPDDRRAQRIQLTDAGREAIGRIRAVACRGMQGALAEWSPEDLRTLAELFHRMVDDFVAHVDEWAAEVERVAGPGPDGEDEAGGPGAAGPANRSGDDTPPGAGV